MLDNSLMEQEKIIRIREFRREKYPNYVDCFYVKDGGNIKITYPDGKTNTQPVKYVGSHHFQCGSVTFHIDEFAELMYLNQRKVMPVDFLTDPALYTKKFYDRELKDGNGTCIPYQEFIWYPNPMDYHGIPALSVAFCAEAQPERQFCFAWVVNGTASQLAAQRRFCSAAEADLTLSEVLPDTLSIDDFRDQDRALLQAFVRDHCPGKQKRLDEILKDAGSRQQVQEPSARRNREVDELHR